jgi:hypothetical protein
LLFLPVPVEQQKIDIFIWSDKVKVDTLKQGQYETCAFSSGSG